MNCAGSLTEPWTSYHFFLLCFKWPVRKIYPTILMYALLGCFFSRGQAGHDWQDRMGWLFHLMYWSVLSCPSWCCPWLSSFPHSLKVSHCLPGEGLPLSASLAASWQISLSEEKRKVIISCISLLPPKRQLNCIKERLHLSTFIEQTFEKWSALNYIPRGP